GARREISFDARLGDRLRHLHVQGAAPRRELVGVAAFACLLVTRARRRSVRRRVVRLRVRKRGRQQRRGKREEAANPWRRHGLAPSSLGFTAPSCGFATVKLMSPFTTSAESTGSPLPMVDSPNRGPKRSFIVSGISDAIAPFSVTARMRPLDGGRAK